LKILVLDGHPDPEREHLCHALADAYVTGAGEGGHDVRRLDIADMDFPLLRSEKLYKSSAPPDDIRAAQEAILWAEHLLIVYPLWLGTLPALVKGFFEQVMRPDFAFTPTDKGWPKTALDGRSVRVVITMGMPALAYRWLYGAHSLKSLERNVLKFVGLSPIHATLFGSIDSADAGKRAAWLDEMRALGRKAA